MLDEMGVLYRGLILGLVIAAPVGPVGLMCIRRTLQKGMLVGLATGLGAACADAFFGSIAVLGVSAILDFIQQYHMTIRIVGGMLVFATAWHTWHDHPKPASPTEFVSRVLQYAPENKWKGTESAAFSGFILTLTNPLTLFGTLAVVATLGAVTKKLEAGVLIGGLFSGSALWWLMLSGGVSLLRRHFNDNRIIILNRVTSVLLAVLALWATASGVRGYLG